MKMETYFKEELGKWIMELSGEVDIASKELFKDQLKRIYEEKQRDIILKADNLSYMDSSGFGVIIGAQARMKENGNTITIENPKENVKKLLCITGLDKVFLK